jgi:hypothetical protein
MGWTPPRQLDVHIQRIISRSVKEAHAAEKQAEQRETAALAARGMLRSGAALTAGEARAATRIGTAGRRMIRETLDALEGIYGSMPIEATAWLHGMLTAWFDGATLNTVADLAQRRTRAHVAVLGIDEEMHRLALELSRDLEIERVPRELRALGLNCDRRLAKRRRRRPRQHQTARS